jgi:hypothetical protein
LSSSSRRSQVQPGEVQGEEAGPPNCHVLPGRGLDRRVSESPGKVLMKMSGRDRFD